MLNGQIYYYDKVLEQLPEVITNQDVEKVELMGVEKFNLADFFGLSVIEVKVKIRSVFQEKYLEFLKENKQLKAYSYWQNLISPFKSLSDKKEGVKSFNKYENQYVRWTENNYNQDNLTELLKDGELESDELSLLLFYGLKVLNKFSIDVQSHNEQNFNNQLYLDKSKHTDTIHDSPDSQILVICSQIFAPLFLNINCKVLDFVDDRKMLLEKIKNVLEKTPTIEFILIAPDEYSKSEEIVIFYSKNLPNNLSIATLDLNILEKKETNQTFFDHIVKKTLGVKLT
jgi:vacuolar-type H+-ATPase subunit F/Vma7